MLTTVPSRLQGINILFLLSNQTDLSNGNLIETKTYPVLIIIFPLQNSYFHKIWTLKNTVPCFGLAVILWLFKWTYLCNCNSFFYIFDIKIYFTLVVRKSVKRTSLYLCRCTQMPAQESVGCVIPMSNNFPLQCPFTLATPVIPLMFTCQD